MNLEDKILELEKRIVRLENTPTSNAPLTIMELIDQLSDMPQGDKMLNGGFVMSWRGDYSQVSVGDFDFRGTVREYVSYLNSKLGETMEGYKGGHYLIGCENEVWADPYGSSEGKAVVGVYSSTEGVELLIKKVHRG